VPLRRYLRLLVEIHPSRDSGRTNHIPEGDAVAVATSRTPQQDPLVPLRLALIAVIAVVVGAVIGTLTFLASPSVPQAVLAGLLAAGTAVLALDKLIGR
jgi:zinc transporter ZupT